MRLVRTADAIVDAEGISLVDAGVAGSLSVFPFIANIPALSGAV